jgi:hypothetical protein
MTIPLIVGPEPFVGRPPCVWRDAALAGQEHADFLLTDHPDD